MKYVTVVILAWVLLSATGLVLAGDAAAGKAKSAACAACHGAEGISSNGLWPNLAGQKEAYMVKQMKAFRDGSRKDPMMGPMSKPLSDADIDNLSAFYSGLK
ncbi:MAG: c-type cytochrome [Gammaproteobacteria bacterium]